MRASHTSRAFKFCRRCLFCAALVLFVSLSVSASEDPSRKTEQDADPAAKSFVTVLRWGKQPAESPSTRATSELERIFSARGGQINFSKRGLRSLLEEANPSPLAHISPFRPVPAIPEQFFFENFAPLGYLVGEKNLRVPPLLAETETADWLELKARESVPLARELVPVSPVSQTLRTLALQGARSSEIFSTPWTKHFDAAATLLEAGGIRCLKKNPKAGPAAAAIELPAHVRCGVIPAKENGVAQQLPKKLGISVPATPASQAQTALPYPACQPAGRLGMQTLELLGDENAGHCLLWRVSQDERFQRGRIVSKLICLNARHKSFQRTRFNDVVAVLPSSFRRDEVHLVEAEDGNLGSQRLSLPTLSLTKTEITTSSGQNLRNSSFPKQRTGLYACQQPPVSQAASSVLVGPSPLPQTVEWIYLDDSVYAGLRPAKSETEVAWRLRETNDATLNVERLSWAQLQYDHPSITSERTFACVTSRKIDSKCGVRVLQTALQLSEEFLSGEFERSDASVHVQITTALLLAQSLAKVADELPDWALREENESLLAFFEKKAAALATHTAFAGSPPNLDVKRKATAPVRRYLDIPRDSQDYLAIKKSLTSAGDFWALLKQKPL